MRNFNTKQKQALLRESNGFCSICKSKLTKGWHADHIIPHSKGGLTDVTNGQALCAACNLKKGNKMTIKLRDWQERGLETIERLFLHETQHCALTHATPGGGKTVHALSVFNCLYSQGHVNKMVVIAPSVNLVDQWATEASQLYNFELKKGMLYKDASDFGEYDGIIMTYASVVNYYEDLRMFCNNNEVLVLSDETHHASEGASWGKAFEKAFELSKHILMLTGTPWTSKGMAIPFVSYNSKGFVEADFTYGKAAAIKESVCRITEFNRYRFKELPYVDTETGAITTYKSAEEALNDGRTSYYSDVNKTIKHMKEVFLDADSRLTELRRSTMNTAGGLLIAGDIQTAHKFQDEIKSLTGQEYPIVHSEMKDPQKAIREFKASNERWLISVNMVSEGVDIKRLQVCVFLSFAKTELFFRQVVGRIERMRTNENLGEIDRVAYFFYTGHPEIDEYVKAIEKDNEAGKALLDELQEERNEDAIGDSILERIPTHQLQDFITERDKLISRGIEYDDSLVEKAYLLKKTSAHLADIPLSNLCKFVLAEEEKLLENQATEYIAEPATKMTLDEQKTEIRKRMNKEVRKKIMGLKFPQSQTAELFKKANYSINKAVGIYKVDKDCSLSELERRLEFIYNSEVFQWI